MSKQNQADIVKATKQGILVALCNQIDQQTNNSVNGKLPYGYVASLVKGHAAVCPWLTRDSINNEMKRRKQKSKLLVLTTTNLMTTSVTDLAAVTPGDRKRGGRPDGATNLKKRMCEVATSSAKNEICVTFLNDKKKAGKKRLPHGHLIKLISRVKRKHNLDEDAVISTHCIRQRVKKGCLEMKDAKPGPKSPLQMYELDFVRIMVQMAKMRQALSPSEGISLINSLIEGTQAQKDLIAFKKQSSYGDSGAVGIGYWRRFKERCEYLICSKKVKNTNWTETSGRLTLILAICIFISTMKWWRQGWQHYWMSQSGRI